MWREGFQKEWSRLVLGWGYIYRKLKGRVWKRVVLKGNWFLVRGTFKEKMKGRVWKRVILKEGWSLVSSTVTGGKKWRVGFEKEWSWKKAGPWLAVHLQEKMKGRFSKRVILKERYPWLEVHLQETEREGFKTSSLKRKLVLGWGYIYRKMWREGFEKEWS